MGACLGQSRGQKMLGLLECRGGETVGPVLWLGETQALSLWLLWQHHRKHTGVMESWILVQAQWSRSRSQVQWSRSRLQVQWSRSRLQCPPLILRVLARSLLLEDQTCRAKHYPSIPARKLVESLSDI
jgi:hypothetical protein